MEGPIRLFAFAVLALALSHQVRAESVEVKYRGAVDLAPFVCTDTKSSFVHRWNANRVPDHSPSRGCLVPDKR
jgi:hypothetical protein